MDYSELKDRMNTWFKLNKPTVRPQSIATYLSKFRNVNNKLFGVQDTFNPKAYNDPKTVYDSLIKMNYATETVRGMMSSVLAVARSIPLTDKAIEGYEGYLKKEVMKRNEAVSKRKITVKEFDFSEQKRKNILAEFKRGLRKISFDEPLSEADRAYIRRYLIFILYTKNDPVRLDYVDMLIVDEFFDPMSTEYNYMDLKKHKFVFNKYKTQGKYGTVIIDIDDDLYDEILKYHKHYTQSKYLLADVRGSSKESMSKNVLSNEFHEVFGLTLVDYRKYVVSTQLQQLIKLLKKSDQLAANMMNSVSVQREYYLNLIEEKKG